MAQDKVNKEYCNLMLEKLDVTTACNYYAGYRIRILEEINTKFKEYQEVKAKTDLTPEEQQKQYTQLDEIVSFIEAAKEHHKLLARLHEKSQRKLNEVNQKVDSFRKRHGIDGCHVSVGLWEKFK